MVVERLWLVPGDSPICEAVGLLARPYLVFGMEFALPPREAGRTETVSYAADGRGSALLETKGINLILDFKQQIFLTYQQLS